MTTMTVDVQPFEVLVDAMAAADSLITLFLAYSAIPEHTYGALVADQLCGSPAEPVLITIEQLNTHLRRSILTGAPSHAGHVVAASTSDGGRGPGMAAGPR